MYPDAHNDEKQERLREKLRDELGPVIVGLLDRSSGLEDIILNEDSRIWVKRTGSSFEQVGELSSRQARGAMMTIASMQKTTVTELRPVLETQLPIWKFRFAGLAAGSYIIAIPITWQPQRLASWPATEPVAPAAPETTTVSPSFGLPISFSPK